MQRFLRSANIELRKGKTSIIRIYNFNISEAISNEQCRAREIRCKQRGEKFCRRSTDLVVEVVAVRLAHKCRTIRNARSIISGQLEAPGKYR